MYVLDTDILIDVLRGHKPAIAWFTTLSELPSVSGFVVMELIQNCQNKQEVQRRILSRQAPIEQLIQLEICL